MKKWWAMVGIVVVAVVILAVCLYGLPFDLPAVNPSGTGNAQLGTTLPPETTEETLPWDSLGLVSYRDPDFITEPPTDYEITRQVLPEIVDNPENLPVLKWVCLVTAGTQLWNDAAVVELNQMLADRDLPYRVQFTILSGARWGALTPDWFTIPEVQKELEDADLIYGSYTTQDMEQWLRPITDHIYGDAQPSLVGALPDLLSWHKCKTDGEIYGIPSSIYSNLQCQGWHVSSEFMKKYGLTVEDFQKNFWEMDQLFAQIYEKNDYQPFIYDNISGVYGGNVGTDGVYGYIPMFEILQKNIYQDKCLCFSIDLQAEKPTVVNMVETDLFTKTHDAVLRYLKAGYMDRDSREIMYDGFIRSTEPYLDTQQNYYVIPNGPTGLPNSERKSMTGVSAKSTHSEEALSLLERIMSDDALRLQLCYGKEGRDYTLDGNVYSLVTQEDGSCYYMDYLSPQAVFFDFTAADTNTSRLVYSTSDYLVTKRQGMTRLESYKADIAQVSFSYCPIVFDYSDLDAELTAIGQVIGDYFRMFTNTEHYSQEYYEEMLQLMEEAGIDTVITELQRQLDAWVAENPDWDPLGGN